MIKSFKHKGLKEFFETGNLKGIQVQHAKKLRNILTSLNRAKKMSVLDIPSYRLHKLKGELNNLWSITVNGNWRITFEFEDENVYVVDYLDYH
jgi:proteic killer suppression protein